MTCVGGVGKTFYFAISTFRIALVMLIIDADSRKTSVSEGPKVYCMSERKSHFLSVPQSVSLTRVRQGVIVRCMLT
jgi:hypothetical protein